MIFSYVKITRNVRLMFAVIFINFSKLRHARESPSSDYYYYYYYYYYYSGDDIQPSTLLSNQSPSGLIL